MRRVLRIVGRLGLGLLLGTALAVLADAFDYGLRPVLIAPDVYVFVGHTEDFDTRNGGNIVNTGFIVGETGVIVIDTGPSRRYGEQMRQAIARVTARPIALVINTHHHPDHFLGNQAFADAPIAALPGTRHGVQADGNSFAENLYRMSGDWLRGTEALPPTRELAAGEIEAGGRRLRLLSLDGHTGADLALIDLKSGVLFAGDLAFNDRAPTTPHADLAHWFAALDTLEAETSKSGFRALVPGHGAVTRDATPIRRTRAWLRWLDGALRQAAALGLDMNEALVIPLPEEFIHLPLAQSEYRRSVAHFYPAYEIDALRGGKQ